MPNDKCSFCGGKLGIDIIEDREGGYRHYSKIDCCDVLRIERNALVLQIRELQESNGQMRFALERSGCGPECDKYKEMMEDAAMKLNADVAQLQANVAKATRGWADAANERDRLLRLYDEARQWAIHQRDIAGRNMDAANEEPVRRYWLGRWTAYGEAIDVLSKTEKRIHLTPLETTAEQRACQHWAADLNTDVCPTCGKKFGPPVTDCNHVPDHNPETGRTYCERCGTTL